MKRRIIILALILIFTMMMAPVVTNRITTTTKEQSYALRKICSRMIDYIFPRKHCLYYISDALLSEVPFVDYCLKNLNAPLVLVNPKKGGGAQNNDNSRFTCDGYLIVSDNFADLTDIFSYGEIDEYNFEFQAHKRILLLYMGTGDFAAPPFSSVANLKGNDIVVVDKLPNYERDLMKYIISYEDGKIATTTNIPEDDIKLRISSIGGDQIFEWNLIDEALDVEKIEFSRWQPNFQRENVTFDVACFDCPPFVYVNPLNGEAFDGVNYRIVKLITRDWPVIFRTSRASFGRNEYIANLRSVHEGRYDLAACPVWLRVTASYRVDITKTYSEVCSIFLVPRPHRIKSIWLVFRPLHPTVWILIGIVTVIVAILLTISSKSQNFTYNLLESIRIISLGSIHRFRRESFFILKMYLIISPILTTAYNARLSSVLTYPIYSREITTIEEMIAEDIRWGETNPFMRDDFLNSSDHGLINLAANFLLEKDDRSRNSHIRSGKYAIHTNRVWKDYALSTQFLNEYGRNNLGLLRECYAKNALAYVLKFNSPYRRILDSRLLRIVESGLVGAAFDKVLDRYKEGYMRKLFSRTDGMTTPEREALDIIRLSGIFYFLLLGYVGGIIAFIGEYWYDVYLKSTYMMYSARYRVRI